MGVMSQINEQIKSTVKELSPFLQIQCTPNKVPLCYILFGASTYYRRLEIYIKLTITQNRSYLGCWSTDPNFMV